jgi:hypothetical protein
MKKHIQGKRMPKGLFRRLFAYIDRLFSSWSAEGHCMYCEDTGKIAFLSDPFQFCGRWVFICDKCLMKHIRKGK